MVTVGVLALQGDVLEHLQLLEELGVRAKAVKRPRDLAGVEGLVIPGGESTTIGGLLIASGLVEPIRELAEKGVPILGTCAGAILLASRVKDRVVGETSQPLLGLMDIAVVRNAFGRQRESFIAELEVERVGRLKVAFIRAPAIAEAWGRSRITGYVDHPELGRVGAAAEQGNMIAVTFHPEITGERRLHQYFVERIKR
ncbi:MAG: pyridoxal 5'-phosphate synthase glutaminase subunit PdxT [Acidilobaceae archaeon]|nr:pyridoxal 5'-phosphate synthase glutaminase subunit PdxT [Acidilobaceae archaeon]MCX8165281.1 pyridoxal 5'-phosphate synthase glutaminase subunit PdxT [Acidilobaceae archaeon]MDW7973707.1 pyridoxal 5'-phosphate synthase glutaminase subunit PdxT [Sulfolobales archaeon]